MSRKGLLFPTVFVSSACCWNSSWASFTQQTLVESKLIKVGSSQQLSFIWNEISQQFDLWGETRQGAGLWEKWKGRSTDVTAGSKSKHFIFFRLDLPVASVSFFLRNSLSFVDYSKALWVHLLKKSCILT